MQNRRDLTRKVLPTGRKSPMELSRRGEADPRDIMERDWRRARANPRNGSRLAGYLKFYGEYGSRSHGFGDYDFRNWSPPDEDIGEGRSSIGRSSGYRGPEGPHGRATRFHQFRDERPPQRHRRRRSI